MYNAQRKTQIANCTTLARVVGLVLLFATAQRAHAVPADGGYECDFLPADAGWEEAGDSFLGDHVTVADGLMTYDGSRSTGLFSNAMGLVEIPFTGDTGTVDVRVRARKVGGNAEGSYQYFLVADIRTDRFNIATSLGHTDSEGEKQQHDVFFKSYLPRTYERVPVPTTTGRWDSNEWITIRTICRPSEGQKFHVECWVSGPTGATKGFETTLDPDLRGPRFELRVPYECRDGAFDLDYIRWSNKAVPWGTPMEAAAAQSSASSLPRARRGAPVAISVLRPNEGTNLGGQKVTIAGDGFQSGAKVTFDSALADDVQVVSPTVVSCVTPSPKGGWSGPADVTVANPDGGTATGRGLYRFERSSTVRPKALGWFIGNEYDHYNLPVAVQKLEEMPFHGAIIRLHYAFQIFNGTVTREMADRDAAMLKRVRFHRFKHNFLYTCLEGFKETGPSLGFFEDWTGVAAGFGIHARVARETGCEGMWVDVEDYATGAGTDLAYGTRNDRSKTFDECRAQVRLRGRELMLAALQEFPNIKIMTAFGLGTGTDPQFNLIPAFLDGMLEAIASNEAYAQAQLIDGYEMGYYITTPREYQMAYDRMRRPGGVAYRRSEQDETWARHGRAAFGVYCGRPLVEFMTMFSATMNRTDEYVWVYTNGTFFRGSSAPSLSREDDRQHLWHYVSYLAEATGLPHAPIPGRTTAIGQWRMEEGEGTTAADSSGLAYIGTLSNEGAWTKDTPTLPKLAQNSWALDLRGANDYVNVGKMGIEYHPRENYPLHSKSNHLGNLYFVDHTLEFSFWWDGKVSPEAQYLYGANGGKGRANAAQTLGYGGWIPAGTREFVHWQRGNHGGEYGGVEIDLAAAEKAGVCRLGRWMNVAVLVNGIDCAKWRLFLNGREVTEQPWAGVREDRRTVGGFQQPPGKRWHTWWQADLVLGARNADPTGVIQHFNGMLDEFRLTAGQVPTSELLSTQ